jgi:hypothetical protein
MDVCSAKAFLLVGATLACGMAKNGKTNSSSAFQEFELNGGRIVDG